jgi:8-amino-7-oxononanoate synthase
MASEAWIEEALAELSVKSLERRPGTYSQAGGKIVVEGRPTLNFSSNDYLDLAGRPEVIAASREALERYGCGATASRLVCGTLDAHRELEDALASLKRYPRAILFGSGFLTNVGLIPALVGRGDHVFADKLVHASIIDGILLSRASLHRFRHNDAEHLEGLLRKCPAAGRRLVVTESVFSMDGDLAPLPAISAAAVRHGAMCMVDEAHATGVFGPGGSGLVREHGLEEDVTVSMGTLSKGLGGYGGFAACSEALSRLLINRARAFIYTTGLPPAVIGSGLAALRVLREESNLGTRLLANAAAFRRRLQDAGLATGDSQSQIIPVIIGENCKALEAAERLKAQGLIAAAIRPPTVPEGTARLRLSVTLAHTPEDLQWAAERVIETVSALR